MTEPCVKIYATEHNKDQQSSLNNDVILNEITHDAQAKTMHQVALNPQRTGAKKNLSRIMYLITIMLCFDSVLKVPIGPIFMQPGILIGLLTLLLISLSKFNSNKPSLIKNLPDKPTLLLVIYAATHIALAKNLDVFFAIFSYLLIYVLMCTMINYAYSYVNWRKIAKLAVILLVATGAIQYIFINFFNFQLELRGLDSSYYVNKGNLGTRMRGFFLEPNWYGLALFSWLFLYYYKQQKKKLADYALTFLAIYCLYLSENRTIFILLVLSAFGIYAGPYIKAFRKWVPFIIVAAATIIYFYFSASGSDLNDRSAMARTYTAANIINIWLSDSPILKIIGHGLSNWGFYSNSLEFSRSNFTFDQALTRRDNAEIYVYLFEMGLICFIIFAYDLITIGKKSKSLALPIFVACIYLSSLFYPIYGFIMYLIPLMVVRCEIFRGGQNANSSN